MGFFALLSLLPSFRTVLCPACSVNVRNKKDLFFCMINHSSALSFTFQKRRRRGRKWVIFRKGLELILFCLHFQLLQKNKSSLESQASSYTTQNQLLNEKQKEIFFNILFYCLLIIISPIVTFFASKVFIFDYIFEPVGSNIAAAVSAVVAIHIALGMFLYRAYFSDEQPSKPIQKQD